MKKVFFIINNFYPGGVEKMIYELVSRLDKNELDIEVLAVIGGGEMLEEFRKAVPVRLLGRVENYRTLKGRVTWLLASPAVLIRTVAYLRRSKPDAVFTSLYHADLLGITAARLAGIKDRVIIQHDVHKLSLLRKILKRKLAIKWATRYVAISNPVKLFLIKYFGAREEKIKVIRNGIDTKRFALAKKDLDLEKIVVGSVGRLEKEKGYMTLLHALELLKEKGAEPHVIIVGGGSEEEKLKNEANNCNLGIEWIGVVKDPVPYLSKMDVVVIPSLEEGFGLTVAEALASEKIIIASDLPAIRDIIIDNVNGRLFKTGNPEYLAKELESILTDKKMIKELKSKVQSYGSQHGNDLSINGVVRKYEEFLVSR